MKKFIEWQRAVWNYDGGTTYLIIICVVAVFLSVFSLLVRDIGTLVIACFALTLSLVSVISVIGALLIRKDIGSSIKKRPVKELWQRRKDWRKGVIKGTRPIGNLFVSLFSLLFGVIISAGCFASLWFFFWDEMWNGLNPNWMIPVVGLGGAILAFYSLWNIWGILRFHSPEFRLTKLPGTIGGELSGVLLLKSRVPIVSNVEVTLRCAHEYQAGKNVTVDDLWEKSIYFSPGEMARWSGRDYLFDVNFLLPEDLAGSRELRGISTVDAIRWYLEARASVPGPDLHIRFEVPVYRTDNVRDIVALSEMEKQNFVHVNPGPRVCLAIKKTN